MDEKYLLQKDGGCKSCANKRYDNAESALDRGWYCFEGKWNERGEMDHRPEDDEIGRGCISRRL